MGTDTSDYTFKDNVDTSDYSFNDDAADVTPGGTPYAPVTIKDTLSSVSPTGNKEVEESIYKDSMRDDFSVINSLKEDGFLFPNQEVANLDASGVIEAGLLKDYEDAQRLNGDRIESILYELVDGYEGKDTEGPIDAGVRDGLARTRNFQDRKDYFKRKYPDGTLFRQKTGGGDFVEMYRMKPNGKTFRVDSDLLTFGDVADVAGSVVNFQTAGGLIGSVVGGPLLGTAAGAYLGGLIDDAISRESDLPPGEFYKAFLNGDTAVNAIVEAVLTKAFPAVGRLIKDTGNRMMGGPKGSLLYDLGIFSVSKSATTAQTAGVNISQETGVKLPALNISQLSNNAIVRGAASQVSGTSSKLPMNLSNQEKGLLKALQVKVDKAGGNYEAFSFNELSNYLNLTIRTNQKGITNLINGSLTKNTSGLSYNSSNAALVIENFAKMKESIKVKTDLAYKTAFNSSKNDAVTFDISNIVKVAKEIEQGILAKGQTKIINRNVESSILGPDGLPINKVQSVTQGKAEVNLRPVGGELKTLTNKLINVLDSKLQNTSVLSVANDGSKVTSDAFQQLKIIRDDVQRVVNDVSAGSERASGVKLLEAIDDLIENGVTNGKIVGGDATWKKAWGEATQLSKLSGQIRRNEKIAKLFTSDAGLNPQKITEGIYDGSFKMEDFFNLQKYMNASAKTQAERTLVENTVTGIKTNFLTSLTKEPTLTASKILKLKNTDNKLYNFMTGDNATREALDQYVSKTSMLSSDPVQAIIDKNMTSGAKAMEYIQSLKTNRQDGAIVDFINANPKARFQIKGALLNKMLSMAQKTDKNIDVGGRALDGNVLIKELDGLIGAIKSNADNEYTAFKGLFGKLKDNGKVELSSDGAAFVKQLEDFRIYSAYLSASPDIGGAFQTGSIRAKLLDVTNFGAGAIQPLLSNKMFASMFAATPSPAQLRRQQGRRPYEKALYAASYGLVRLQNALNLTIKDGKVVTEAPAGAETIEEEVNRTQNSGLLSSKVTSPPVVAPVASNITPRPPVIPPIPRAPVPPQTQNRFASLFPNDSLGNAISQQPSAGIMGLV